MKKLLLFVCLVLCPALYAQAVEKLEVASARFDGENVVVTFNKPMQPLSSLDEMSKLCPLTLSPFTDGTCKWTSEYSFIFIPNNPLKKASRYTASIDHTTASEINGARLGRDYNFSFDTQMLTVSKVFPSAQQNQVQPDSLVFIMFNMPVSVTSIAKTIELKSDKGNYAFNARYAFAEEIKTLMPYEKVDDPKQVIALEPRKPFDKDTFITVYIAKRAITKGEGIGLNETFSSAFKTYPPLTVEGLSAPDYFPFNQNLFLSTPVTMQALRDALVLPEGLKLAEADGREAGAYGYFVSGNYSSALPVEGMKPGADYDIVIKGSLTDIYGQQLGEDVYINFENKGYRPEVSVERGFMVSENAFDPMLGLTAISVSTVNVTMSLINPNDFIPFYTAVQNGKKDIEPVYETKADKTINIEHSQIKTLIPVSQTEVLGGKTSGIVYTQTQAPLNDDVYRSYNNITDTAVTFKAGPLSSLAWITSLSKGMPKKGVKVEIRNEENEILWTGKTNSDGLVKIPGFSELKVSVPKWGAPTLWLLAFDKGDAAILSSEFRKGVEPWRFNIDSEYSPKASKYKTFTFTDRGVYRPGDIVHVKGVLRKVGERQLEADAKIKEVRLQYFDSQDNLVKTNTVAVNAEWGVFEDSFVLEESAVTGGWRIETSDNSELLGSDPLFTSYAYFNCAVYTDNELELSITPATPSFMYGENYEAYVDGRYLFGAPTANLEFEWKLNLVYGWYTPKGFDKVSSYIPMDSEYDFSGEIIASGKGTFDRNGHAVIKSALTQKYKGAVMKARLEVTATTTGGNKISASNDTLIHPSKYYIGIINLNDSYVITGTDTYKTKVLLTDKDGAFQDNVKISGKLKRIVYYSTLKSVLGGRLEMQSEKNEEIIKSFSFISKDGGNIIELDLDKTGSYLLELSSADDKDREARAVISVMKSADSAGYWQQTNTDMLELTADKEEYEPGDRAKILVQNPYDEAYVLVTVERDSVLWSSVRKLVKGDSVVEVKIEKDYFPNVFFSAVLIKGRTAQEDFGPGKADTGKPQAKIGYKTLKVVNGDYKLTPEIITDKKEYKPGEQVKLQIKTLAASGLKVKSDLTLYAVDKAVLNLNNYQIPDIYSEMYSPYPLSVLSADSRLYVLGRRDFGEKGKNTGGGGGDESDAAFFRTKLEPLAFWKGSLVTDGRGQAETSFALPDNLTEFVIIAVAASKTAFGSSSASIAVNKPVMIKTYLPKFTRLGDTFNACASVFNYTKAASTFTVHITAGNSVFENAQNPSREIFIEQGGNALVCLPLKAIKLGSETVKMSAHAGQESDAVAAGLSVQPITVKEEIGFTNSINERFSHTIVQPADSQNARIELFMSPSPLASLKGAVDYLENYPYDCLEQRLSKLYPYVSSKDLLERFFNVEYNGSLTKKVNSEIAALTAYQFASGAFGYWPSSSRESVYVSAYALEIFTMAKNMGFEVPQKAYDKLKDYLTGALSGNLSLLKYDMLTPELKAQFHALYAKREWEENITNDSALKVLYEQNPQFQTQLQRMLSAGMAAYSSDTASVIRAYVIYALAFAGEQVNSYFNAMYNGRFVLSLEAKAYLLKASHYLTRDSKIKRSLFTEMNALLQVDDRFAYFETETNYDIHSGVTKATALCLDAMLLTDIRSSESYKIVSWLLRQRQQKSYWPNTQDNVYVLSALSKFYASEGKDSDFKVDVKTGETTLFTQVFQNLTPATASLNILFPELDNGKLLVEKRGNGRFYYTTSIFYEVPDTSTPKRYGFNLKREQDAKPDEIKPGEVVKVTLSVTSQRARRYVVLEDYLPAGAVAVNQLFATEQKLGQNDNNSVFTKTEIYDDRVVAFAEYLPAGTFTFTYYIRYISGGVFFVPSAKVADMYDPGVYATTGSSEINIVAK